MKTIGIVGASGKAGRFLVHESQKKGYRVRVLVRDIKTLKYFMHYLNYNVEVIEGDVHSKDDLKKLLTGCDLVINTLGQLKNCGGFYESTVKNILSVMDDLKIDKYLGVCASTVLKEGDQRNFIHKIASRYMYMTYPHMMIDKTRALLHLENSSINWTLYRVPKIIEFSKLAKISTNQREISGFKINNRSLAKLILENIDKGIYHNNTVFVWE